MFRHFKIIGYVNKYAHVQIKVSDSLFVPPKNILFFNVKLQRQSVSSKGVVENLLLLQLVGSLGLTTHGCFVILRL